MSLDPEKIKLDRERIINGINGFFDRLIEESDDNEILMEEYIIGILFVAPTEDGVNERILMHYSSPARYIQDGLIAAMKREHDIFMSYGRLGLSSDD